tara:strand:- start:23 stop:364 length:342 start_codon:yes stop_codon:yes gene_type:complete
MNSLIFGLLTAISLIVFLKLGKIKASTKQLNRDNRIKWRRNHNQSSNEDADSPKIEEGKSTQIGDQDAATLGKSNQTSLTVAAALPDPDFSTKLGERKGEDNQDAEHKEKQSN